MVGWDGRLRPVRRGRLRAGAGRAAARRRARRRARPRTTYAHVILDEAQDLSPMECRMIARRAAYASMTIVGDLGQATHPLAADSWPELLARLGRREARTLDLRTGYRVPQAIADYAARALAPGIAPTRSYRPGGTLSVRPGRRPRARPCGRPSGRRRRGARPRSSPPTTDRRRSRRSVDLPGVTVRAGQPGQGPRVRPRDRGRAGRHRRRRTPRPAAGCTSC